MPKKKQAQKENISSGNMSLSGFLWRGTYVNCDIVRGKLNASMPALKCKAKAREQPEIEENETVSLELFVEQCAERGHSVAQVVQALRDGTIIMRKQNRKMIPMRDIYDEGNIQRFMCEFGVMFDLVDAEWLWSEISPDFKGGWPTEMDKPGSPAKSSDVNQSILTGAQRPAPQDDFDGITLEEVKSYPRDRIESIYKGQHKERQQIKGAKRGLEALKLSLEGISLNNIYDRINQDGNAAEMNKARIARDWIAQGRQLILSKRKADSTI